MSYSQQERLGASAPAVLVQTDLQIAKAREALGEERFEELLAEGRRLITREAVALSGQFAPPPDAPPLPTPTLWGMAEASHAEPAEMVRD